MRQIAVVTSARSDLGIYTPVMRAIDEHQGLQLRVVATGMHLSPEFGFTIRHVEEAGFRIDERVESLVSSDSPAGIAKSVALGVAGFAQLFSARRPDLLLVLGDRFDMYPAAIAALPFRIPVAHIAGGEATEGLIDESIRHSLTKLSHLHFVSTTRYRDRVVQMGEEPWRVVVAGMPSLDNIRQASIPSPEDIRKKFGLSAAKPLALVTFHPVTLECERTEAQVGALIAALRSLDLQCVFTYPNADTAGRIIIDRIEAASRERPDWQVLRNARQEHFYGLLKTAAVMVGNSSSGIIEAASFELPVVNIGIRQQGRIRPRNVIDCLPETGAIQTAIERVLAPVFRESLKGLANPYGDGMAAGRIVSRLAEVPLNDRLIIKRFHQVSSETSVGA